MEYVTAGESHGPALTVIVSGVPAGLSLDQNAIDADLRRRQGGYGRGGRMAIEHDRAVVTGGVRFGRTLGSPVCMVVENRDHDAWSTRMSVFGKPPADLKRETTPRPGHADLCGALKTRTDDCRDILERASARETAARVAAGTVARAFLKEVGVEVLSYVTCIGDVSFEPAWDVYDTAIIEESPVRCPDAEASARMCAAIDAAKEAGDSLGGRFRVVATGLTCGLGGYVSASDRLDGRLGGALLSIPAIKEVGFGLGSRIAEMPGSLVHDEIVLDEAGYHRRTNNAGGLEGGMTTGEPLVMSACMKPIPTLRKPLATVDMESGEAVAASKERSDTCAVPAAAVVAEAEVALVLASAYEEKFGGDCMADTLGALDAYRKRIAP